MENLGTRISPKVADAARRVIGSLCQISCVELPRRKCPLLKLVVLAVKAVKGARIVENSQVFISVFRAINMGIARVTASCACRTHKVSHTIGRQGVIIIGQVSLMGPSALQLSVADVSKTAKTCLAFWNATPVKTDATRNTLGITRRFYWKAVSLAASGMNFGDLWPDYGKMVTDAICTKANDI